MRHVFTPSSITPVTFGAGEATIPAPSVAATGLTLRPAPCLPGATLGAIPVPPIAMTTNQDLRTAAGAKEKAACPSLIKIGAT